MFYQEFWVIIPVNRIIDTQMNFKIRQRLSLTRQGNNFQFPKIRTLPVEQHSFQQSVLKVNEAVHKNHILWNILQDICFRDFFRQTRLSKQTHKTGW